MNIKWLIWIYEYMNIWICDIENIQTTFWRNKIQYNNILRYR